MKARSFDEVVEKLILNMFGVDKDVILPFTERDRMGDKEW